MGTKLKIVDYNILKDEIHVTGNYEIWKSLSMVQINYIIDINNNIVWENKILNKKLNKNNNTSSDKKRHRTPNSVSKNLTFSIGVGEYLSSKNIGQFGIGTEIYLNKTLATFFGYGFNVDPNYNSFSTGFALKKKIKNIGLYLNYIFTNISIKENIRLKSPYNYIDANIITSGLQYNLIESLSNSISLNLGYFVIIKNSNTSDPHYFISIESNFGRSK